MRRPVQLTRPHRLPLTVRRVARPAVVARTVKRTDIARPTETRPRADSASWGGFQPNPYVDYGRYLTAEGGILIIYKDIDLRWRHTIWRVFAWSMFCGIEGWFLFYHSPVRSEWLNAFCFLAVAIINWLIVSKLVELYRQIEIRPDCMIIDGADIFWSRYMDNGWPGFRPDAEGNQVLCGIYGTRYVAYLTVRRFDEFDRMSEVFAAHLQDAMQQLWNRPASLS